MIEEAITLPQANSIKKIFLLLKGIPTDLTDCFNVQDASEIICMSNRQGKYYLDALIYLSLVKKFTSNSYILTEEGKQIVTEDILNVQYLNFIYFILKNKKFYVFYYMYETHDNITFKELFIQYVIDKYSLSQATAERRFSTILKWCKTINENLSNIKID